MIDIVKFISDKCEVLDYSFVLSKTENVNADLIGIDFRDGRNVLYMTLPSADPKQDGMYYNHEIDFEFSIMLCRKFENETFSSVAETTTQKYDNRLHELQSLMVDFITNLSSYCDNKISVKWSKIALLTNIYSTSVDGAATNITASAWGQ